MNDPANSLRVAIVGEGAGEAHEVLAALTSAGFAIAENVEDCSAVIVLAGPQDPAGTMPAGKPVIVASTQIDMEVVRQAAELGAHDVVLRSDPERMCDSVHRAALEYANASGVAASDSVPDELLRRTFDLTPTFVSIRDKDGCFVIVSQAYADLHGTTVDAMLGKPATFFAQNAQHAEEEIAEDAEVLQTRRSRISTREVSDSAGARRMLQAVKRPIVLDDGRAFVLCVAVDVTRSNRAESTLEKTNEFLKNILETISDAVFALDVSGRFTLANQRLAQMTGYKHHELIGMSFKDVFVSDFSTDVQRLLKMAGESHKEKRFEARMVQLDGHQRTITCGLVPLKQNDRVIGIVGTAADITERKAAEQRIEHLAYHDPLTNLPNRRLLNDRLTMALSQARRDGRMVAVLFLDLDRFKSINDSLGHRTGDALLQELGARLQGCVRAGDTVARMGGDEFVFLLPAIDIVEQATTVARKVLDVIRKPFTIEGREFVVTGCMGVSLYPSHAHDADTLIKQADIALFESKRRGSDRYAIFDDSMSARSLDRFILENELRRAITHGELTLVYQPIVEMRTERIISVEALVRWNHPERGLLSPEDFIGVAEESRLISALGDWVLREACRQNREWQRRGLLAVPVAVNISARQLDRDLVASVSEALDATSLPAQYLDLELTESILMESAASSSMVLDALKQVGTRISVDDFGTGYSSLSYLERFPIDALKIDRSFMPVDPQAAGAGVIASTIISMAQTLGIEVIAEGVETREQRDFLLARGCSRAQGHYYWSAMTPQALETLMSGDARDSVLA